MTRILNLQPENIGNTSLLNSRLAKLSQMSEDDRLRVITAAIRENGLVSLAPVLPALFSLKGEPYSIKDHFPFEPVFNTAMPHTLVLQTGRQTSKSTSLAAQGVASTAVIPFFNTLYCTPLFEMVRRFSSNYVRNFIEDSPVKNLMIDSSCNNSVLQRSFKNRSTMFFSYAFLNTDRVRGINADRLAVDEAQDMDKDFIPLLQETLSGSKRWGITQIAGTPKTLDGTMAAYWEMSSQAEWHIKCTACNYINIACNDHDLDKMTGLSFISREISEACPGIVCANCGRPIFPRTGRWLHRFPERKLSFPGFHIPQHILPLHYADRTKWLTLVGKRDSLEPRLYFNEVCGESYDKGSKLLTQTEIQAACQDRDNDYVTAQPIIHDYMNRVCSVDWGGGGEKQTSFTVISIMGTRGDGRQDVLYGERLKITHNYFAEAQRILQVMNDFKCQFLVHDFSGAGAIREQILVNAGLPIERIIPVAYIRAGAGTIMRYKPENQQTGMRGHYQLDKTRSLVQTCSLVKTKQIGFFRYDYKSQTNPGLLHDFLALVEENTETISSSNIYTITRGEHAGPDDFAQAVNIGSCALFYIRGVWPNLAKLVELELTAEQLAMISPTNADWDMD